MGGGTVRCGIGGGFGGTTRCGIGRGFGGLFVRGIRWGIGGLSNGELEVSVDGLLARGEGAVVWLSLGCWKEGTVLGDGWGVVYSI